MLTQSGIFQTAASQQMQSESFKKNAKTKVLLSPITKILFHKAMIIWLISEFTSFTNFFQVLEQCASELACASKQSELENDFPNRTRAAAATQPSKFTVRRTNSHSLGSLADTLLTAWFSMLAERQGLVH